MTSHPFWKRCSSIAVLAFLTTIPVRGASLTCRFVDEHGKLLHDVETRLTPAGSDAHVFQKVNKQGEAVFHSLNPGAYELRAQLTAHMPLKWVLQFSDDQTLQLTLMTQQGFDKADKQAVDHINSGAYSKAAPVLEKLLNAYPLDAELHDHLAKAYAEMGNEDQARAQAKQAVGADPQFSDSPVAVERIILVAHGNDALQKQDFPKAAEAFEALVKVDPQNAKGYFGLALAYGHQGNIQQALPAINQAVELDPKNDSYRKVQATLQAHAAGN